MSALVIGHITVRDAEQWAQYRTRVPATLAPFGAELVFRGQRGRLLAGTHAHADTVVIRFPDLASVDRWYDSPAYQALLPLRQAAADIDLVSFSE